MRGATLKIINTKCPNCGAELEFSTESDRTSCDHCGGKFVITDGEAKVMEASAVCIVCKGTGFSKCMGMDNVEVIGRVRKYELFVEGCMGDGKCQVSCYPPKNETISNYCINGKCAWCNGTGKYLRGECLFCKGTGNCRFCNGTGICKFCNGEGVTRCRECGGTGSK